MEMNARDLIQQIRQGQSPAVLIEKALSLDWLKGVRKGWQHLMNPVINNFDDVLSAYDALLLFIKNFKEQVLVVQRTGHLPRIQKDLDAFEAAWQNWHDDIEEKRYRASRWKQDYDGTNDYLDSDARKHGQKMLDLYMTKFADINEIYIYPKRASKNNPYKHTVRKPNEYLFDQVLKLARAAVRNDIDIRSSFGYSLDPHEGEPMYREFKIGRAHVSVVDDKVYGDRIARFVKAIDKVYQLMRKKGLGTAFYGHIKILGTKSIKPTEAEKLRYKQWGYDLEQVAGRYFQRGDRIELSTPPSSVDEVLAHEIGHRWYYQLPQKVRAKWDDWFAEKKFKPVSSYGKTNANEAFAEAFMQYVLNIMRRNEAVLFKQVLSGFGESKDLSEYVPTYVAIGHAQRDRKGTLVPPDTDLWGMTDKGKMVYIEHASMDDAHSKWLDPDIEFNAIRRMENGKGYLLTGRVDHRQRMISIKAHQQDSRTLRNKVNNVVEQFGRKYKGYETFIYPLLGGSYRVDDWLFSESMKASQMIQAIVEGQDVDVVLCEAVLGWRDVEHWRKVIKRKGPLQILAKHAKDSSSFDDFEYGWLGQNRHGLYWHVTDDPQFRIDVKKGPRDMSSLATGNTTPGALMITSHLADWLDYGDRPYAAEIDVTSLPTKTLKQVNRGFGNEFFISDASKLKVIKVWKIKAAIAKDARVQKQKPQSRTELAYFYTAATGKDSGLVFD